MRIKPFTLVLASLLAGLTLTQAQTSAPVVAPRTSAYASVMVNAAADNSVLDYTKRPTLIGDQQYVVGSGNAADLVNAAFSMKGGAFNWFGMVTASTAANSPDILNFGLANGLFGAGLSIGLAKTDATAPVSGTETRTTYNMDGLGAFGNFRLSPTSDVYGKLSVTTDYAGDTADDYLKVGSVERKNSIFALMGGWKLDASKEGDHSLNLEATLSLGSKKDPSGPDTGSLLDVGIMLSHGYWLKQASTYSVFVGSNTLFEFMGETRNKTDMAALGLAISPNIEFQKTLAKGFEAFSGASATVTWVTADKVVPGTDTYWALMTNGANVSVGLRWSYENLALEGKVADMILFDGPEIIGGTSPGLFTEVGLALGF